MARLKLYNVPSSSRRDSRVHSDCPGYSLHAYHVLELHLISRERLGSSSHGSEDRHIWESEEQEIKNDHYLHVKHKTSTPLRILFE